MDIQQAKDTLEEIGIADEITKELVEASTVVLDTLSELESWKARFEKAREINTDKTWMGAGALLVSSVDEDEEGVISECNCRDCIEARQRTIPQRTIPQEAIPTNTDSSDSF